MKPTRLLLPLASFTAAILTARFWPPYSGAAADEKPSASALDSTLTGKPESTPSKTISQALEPSPSAVRPGPGSATPPSMAEVFAATGLDRMLLMARFIQTASVEELKEVIDRAEADDSDESTFIDEAWLRWVELDLEGALHHKGPPSEWWALKRPNRAWWAFAKLDPQAALARALKSQPSMLGAVLNSIGQSDPALARRVLAEHPEADDLFYGSHVRSGVKDGMAKYDPADATALALEQGGIDLDSTFNHWMERDPERAQAWMRGLTNPATRRRLEDLAMTQLITNDPAAGLKAALQLPPGRSQASHAVKAISALSSQDPAAARAAAEALASPYTRQLALGALADSMASTDPASAAASLVSYLELASLNRSSGVEVATESTLTQLMSTAPEITADALAALATASEPSFGPLDSFGPLAKAVQKWAAAQPEAASVWLKNQPPGAARDLGIEGLSEWLLSSSAEPDFAAALAWAGAVSEERQFQYYERTLSAWKKRDPQGAAAKAAVDTLPIPSETRERLLKVINSSNDSPIAK